MGLINEKKRDNIPHKKRSKMIAELIIPIETLRGQLRKDGYYFRLYKGKQIVQRCPNRKGHVKTASEQANQERFVERYRKKKRAQNERGMHNKSRMTSGETDIESRHSMPDN